MFAVLEIQTNVEGTMALVPPLVYGTMNEALSAFYTKMVSATQSSVHQHTIAIMDNVGTIVKKETVFHEVEEDE
jgi:hypothetical protein